MDGVGLWVTCFGAATLALWLVSLWFERKRDAEIKWFTFAFVALMATVVLTHHGDRIGKALTGERIHVWNQYHYYVGSKYFGEVGYFDLYAATLAADDAFVAAGGDPAEGFGHIRKTRDMHTYKVRPREEIAAEYDASAFTPERLAELGEDSRWIRARTPDEKSRRMLKDLGYNPAPPWTLLGTPMTNLVDLGGPLYATITASDLFVHVLVFGVLLWAFGLRTAAVATIWMHLIPINLGRMTGAFFTYDWLGAAVLGWALYHKDRPKLGAVALSWAAMTRVFPGLIAIPIVVRAGWDLVRRDREAPAEGSPEAAALHKRRSFAVAFCVACAVLFGASHFTGRGLDTWPEWTDKIVRHSSTHAWTSSERVGLGKLVQHQPDRGRFWTTKRKGGPEFKAKAQRRKRVAQLLGLALLVAAIWKRSDAEAMVAMLFASWLMTTSSRYYASIWVLLFALPRRSLAGAWSGAALLAMLATFHLLERKTGQYLLLNYEAAILFVGLCACYLLASWRERRAADPDGATPPDPSV
jgi:hypothetical protein